MYLHLCSAKALFSWLERGKKEEQVDFYIRLLFLPGKREKKRERERERERESESSKVFSLSFHSYERLSEKVFVVEEKE